VTVIFCNSMKVKYITRNVEVMGSTPSRPALFPWARNFKLIS